MRTLAPLVPFALALSALAACADATQPRVAGAERFDGTAANATTTITSTFIARADCVADLGYSIWFGGTRVMRESVQGGSVTRSFVVNDFRGWNTAVTAATYQSVAPFYSVSGGAEMFNIKVGVTRIHEGTLVFVALDGSTRVVARHIIRNVPGQETGISTWECREVG